MRRTTTHDAMWPDGLSGPVALVANGRDLVTTGQGTAEVVDTASVAVTVEYLKGTITAVNATPMDAGLTNLVGSHAFAGFRRTVDAALPGEATSHSLRFQLLDELPAAVLASGRALRAAGIRIEMKGRTLPVDICAGWMAGGTLLTGMTDMGPPFHIGPNAPALDAGNDDLAWHETALLPPHGTRRRRRLDLWEENGRACVDCFFRDSYVNVGGIETVVHEWAVQAEFDPETRCFVSAGAETGPLPYPECPGAGASAGRLVGMPIEGLRRAVYSSLVGPSTCTHLNDTFRSMEDAGALLDVLRASTKLKESVSR